MFVGSAKMTPVLVGPPAVVVFALGRSRLLSFGVSVCIGSSFFISPARAFHHFYSTTVVYILLHIYSVYRRVFIVNV